MKRKWVIVLIAILAVSVIGGTAWMVLGADPELGERVLAELGIGQPEEEPLRASGFIEVDEADIGSELGGRIVALPVAEGDAVEAGETVFELDRTLIEAQIAMARVRVATAEAELAQARAQPRSEQLRQAQAAVELARRRRDGAHQAWQDLLALQENPQDLNVEIARARAEVDAARAAVARAEAQKDAAEIGYETFHDAREEIWEAQELWREIPEPVRPPKPELEVPLDFHLLPNQYWQSWVALNTARERLEAARTALNDLVRMRDNPQELLAQVSEAATQYAAAEERVEQAEGRLDALQTGATPEDLAVLEAHIQEAEAELATLLSERDKLTVTAPMRGLILHLGPGQGELVAPGATVLTLGNLDEVTLTVFIPVPRLGEVRIGQNVTVHADAYPERIFAGEVVAIAEQAEFAPREIEIREDRMNLVFAVEIAIPNPDHALKPGGYAAADFTTDPATAQSGGTSRADAARGGTSGREDSDSVTASGFIEGIEITVAAAVDGRVAALPVRRGDPVAAGDLLVRLDDAALQHQRGQAEAALATAEANLARVRAGASAGEIAAASAELAEAEVVHTGALDAVTLAREAVDNPQTLHARVNQARAAVALADQKVEMARAELAATELKRNVYAERGGDIERTWDLQVEAAEAALRESEAELRGARAVLAALLSMRADPLHLQAELHRAENEAKAAEVQVEIQRARIDELQAGSMPEEIAVAEQRVAEAQVAIDLIDARIAQLTLEAPRNGVVSGRLAHVGEAAVAGRPLLTIADLDEVTLTIYLPQRAMARVEIGQPVSVAVKAFPEQEFSGQVSSIASEAQFTPSDVLTEEERVSLVFAVEVTITNPDHILRPGMPADTTLQLRGP